MYLSPVLMVLAVPELCLSTADYKVEEFLFIFLYFVCVCEWGGGGGGGGGGGTGKGGGGTGKGGGAYLDLLGQHCTQVQCIYYFVPYTDL